jgi:hypothetical protein
LLARLCASLTEQRLPGDVPSRWQHFLADAGRTDSWRLYLRALAGWWGADAAEVHAELDLESAANPAASARSA